MTGLQPWHFKAVAIAFVTGIVMVSASFIIVFTMVEFAVSNILFDVLVYGGVVLAMLYPITSTYVKARYDETLVLNVGTKGIDAKMTTEKLNFSVFSMELNDKQVLKL